MSSHAFNSFRLQGRLLPPLAVLICLFAFASATEQQRAIYISPEDDQLVWGPCPEFFPEGCRLAVLHGDPTKNDADVYLKVPPNSIIPHHWHTSAERMILVSGELHVTYDGQETAILKPGTYGFGPAKVGHRGFCAGSDPCILFVAFDLPVDAVPTGN